MSVIELLWYLNVTDNTKYLIFFGIIVCMMMICVMNGKKTNNNKKRNKLNKYKNNNSYNNLNKEDTEYINYFMKSSPTKCQSNYMKCIENNVKNNKNEQEAEFCYPCLNNGNSPDFFYNPQINQWVKLN